MSLANLGCGCFCWTLPRSLFALFLCWMAKRISGWGICVSPFAVWVCFFGCAFDLPTYMTTGVHVDVILTCFFSCKDRASERYRPHQRKKNKGKLQGHVQLLFLVPASCFLHAACFVCGMSLFHLVEELPYVKELYNT